jgi:polyhydroxyalkanoate synthesis repressor PhaR
VIEERIIRKYPNRRLYDTGQSKYITQSDVRDLVMSGIRFKVVDSATKEDLTRQTLMQIIIEEEAGGRPLFTAEMLSQLIRFYGGTMQGVFSRYLEESFNLFANQQREAQEGIPKDPIETFNTLTKKNLEMWSDMQRSFMKAAGLTSGKDSEKS